jgi:hypothetical protein
VREYDPCQLKDRHRVHHDFHWRLRFHEFAPTAAVESGGRHGTHGSARVPLAHVVRVVASLAAQMAGDVVGGQVVPQACLMCPSSELFPFRHLLVEGNCARSPASRAPRLAG